jgi:uncharacterized protein (TIRG00374 family)
VLVDRLGWSAIVDAVTNAGWWFLWIAIIDLLSVFSDSAAVYSFVRAEAPASYWRVFAAQASGIAINRLTPGNSVGEALKVTMMLDHVPKETAVSAVVKFNLATMYTALTIVLIGVPLTLLQLDLPPQFHTVVWVGTACVIALGLTIAILVRRGALATLIGIVRMFGLITEERAAQWTEKMASIDKSLASFNTRRARQGVAFVLGSRVLHSLATILVLHAAGVPFTAPVIVCMLSVGILTTWICNVVPLGLGLADGSNYVLYGALGSTGIAGIAFTMVNRTRTCVLAGMGLTVMAIANVRRPSVLRTEGPLVGHEAA